MKVPSPKRFLPNWKNAMLAILSSILLILAFPDFEYWFLAWFALVPLMWAVEREKASSAKSFVLGWLFGTIFFFGTCWWLAYAPIHYAAFPPLLAYSLILAACLGAGVFPGVFAAVLSTLLRRFGSIAMLAAPFVWVSTEFLRYWLTGNNWNALGYSQALGANSGVIALSRFFALSLGAYGGVLVSSGYLALVNCWIFGTIIIHQRSVVRFLLGPTVLAVLILALPFAFFMLNMTGALASSRPIGEQDEKKTAMVVIQPNVPMSGLTFEKWRELRQRHVRLAESALNKVQTNPQSAIRNPQSTTVVFPESPMNFEYDTDAETKAFIDNFAKTHNVSVLFNSAEPDRSNGKFFNSAVMVSPEGTEVAQYDKIYLLPFGEAVPVPFESIVPAFVGSFSYGKEYDLFPLGDAKAGVMICFESHFGQLSREYVRNGADVIIEMTNDGYLGPTPVLRQHLANAVFRAVETNRPVLRVTNVGLTAYINERGEVLDAAVPYTEDTRVWSVSKSDGTQTLYVRYGDWFAWLCSIVTLCLIGVGLLGGRKDG